MGNMCGSDPYNELKTQLGPQFTQWVVGKSTQSMVGEKLSALQSQVTSQASNLQSSNLAAIDTQKSAVTSQFNSLKQSLSSSFPGGISAFEQQNGNSVDNLLGYNDQIKKFDDLKQNVTSKFSN